MLYVQAMCGPQCEVIHILLILAYIIGVFRPHLFRPPLIFPDWASDNWQVPSTTHVAISVEIQLQHDTFVQDIFQCKCSGRSTLWPNSYLAPKNPSLNKQFVCCRALPGTGRVPARGETLKQQQQRKQCCSPILITVTLMIVVLVTTTTPTTIAIVVVITSMPARGEAWKQQQRQKRKAPRPGCLLIVMSATMHTCAYVYMCIYICVHVYIYIYIHTYTYLYTYIIMIIVMILLIMIIILLIINIILIIIIIIAIVGALCVNFLKVLSLNILRTPSRV